MKPFEKRFGMIAVGKGFVTLDQLLKALKVQIQEDVEGPSHRLIGEILVDMGFLTPSQIVQILDAMDRGMRTQERPDVRE